MMHNYLPNNTKRILLSMSINGHNKKTLLRVRESMQHSDMVSTIDKYLDALEGLHSLNGLVSAGRISRVEFLGALFAERGSNVFIPVEKNPVVILSGTGTPIVRDLISLASITGRTVLGSKVVFYFPSICADIGGEGLSGPYSDMSLSSGEVPALNPWFDYFWRPSENSLFNELRGPDNSPIAFIRGRLLVRFSSKMTRKLRNK